MSGDVLETPCGGCGRTLRVAPEHAGKMARCPVCSHITLVPDVPSQPSAVAPVEVANSPAASVAVSSPPNPASLAGTGLGVSSQATEWYLRTPEEQTFGPATFEDLGRWVNEGRITSDCRLSQGPGEQWQPADWLFPSLKLQPSFNNPQVPFVPASPFGAIPGPGVSYGGSTYSPRPAAPNLYPPPGSYSTPVASYRTAHRGPLILILGLMGLFIHCPVFPIMAWVMGSNDLREMQSGRMDPSGKDLTRTGMILGMILSCLWILGFLFIFGLMLLGMAGH